jgi:UDP-glucose 4-epimerase
MGAFMNILVTGGAGYIGSAIAEALINSGHSVTVYDSLVTGHRQAIPESALFIQADLSDSHALANTLTDKKFDGVIHCAAFIEAGESMKDPGRFYHNNLTNSLVLMETAIRTGVKRFVLSSTAAVYQSSDQPLTEESPIGPTNVYGHTKLMVEQALDWYCKIHDLHFAALRYFNAAGALPGRGEAHQPESHLIPWCCVSLSVNGVQHKSMAQTIPHRMGLVSAITFISRIWSPRTCLPWMG